MDECISREKVLKKLQMQLLDLESNQDKGEYSELCENRGARDALDEAIYDIRTIKAADVQPVKHGRWENTNTPNQLRCSKCEVIHFIAQYPHGKINFCPNCGARMDGDEE